MSTPPTDKDLLQKCRLEIEAKLGWGDPQAWTSQDFELLSERIFTDTRIRISVSTLKRIWGRASYTSEPNTATLNALAGFLSYDSWRAYRQAAAGVVSPPPEEPKPAVRSTRFPFYGLGLAGLLLGVFYFVRPAEAPDPDQFSFDSRPVVKGIPNSVIFRYDASKSDADSVFIQQSWDDRRRARVSKNQHEHTSIYYSPGYFRAKLIVGNRVVKEHDLLVPTDGWLPLVIQEPVPVYFRPEEAVSDSVMRLPASLIEKKGIPLQPQTPWTSYYYVKDFQGVKSDAFRFETELRHEFGEGSAACRKMQVLLLTTDGVYLVPLSAPGCIADLSVMLRNESVSGRDTDLSAFGIDSTGWTRLVLESKNGQLRILINGREALRRPAAKDPARIVGMVYQFQGTGAIRNVALYAGDRPVFTSLKGR